MKRTATAALCAATIVALGAVSCGEDPGNVGVSTEAVSAAQALSASAVQVYPLQMGNTNQTVGEIRVWNDETTLFVEYQTYSGYELADAHVCASLSPLSWTPPGQCPYKVSSFPAGTTYQLFEIPLTDLGLVDCGAVIYLQVHASINDAATQAGVGSAYAGIFKGQVAFDVTCDPPPEEYGGCTYTQGFWKNKPRAWPVDSLTLGGVTYSQKQLIALLRTPPKGGDASLILSHQLIAALLNLENGASAPAEVQDAIDGAQAWLLANADGDGLLPFYTLSSQKDEEGNAAEWDAAIALAAVLDLFNNGDFGPEHCQ